MDTTGCLITLPKSSWSEGCPRAILLGHRMGLTILAKREDKLFKNRKTLSYNEISLNLEKISLYNT